MKLEKLTINNFRIFNGQYEFDFTNKSLIVVNGPNGNGKSTIFDSIQWCLTGKIPRYDGSTERHKFNYLMNEQIFSLNYSVMMFVEIIFRSEQGTLYKVRRTQEKNKEGRMLTPKITINDESYNVTNGAIEIKTLLKDPGFFEDNSEIDQSDMIDLSSFFASTQLLSQDALENFIRSDKPNERYRLIDSILGIRKYGVDFEEFIRTIKETAKNQLDSLEEKLVKPKEDLMKLKYEILEKEKLMIETGQISPRELLHSLKVLIFEEELSNRFVGLDPQVINNLDEKLLLKLVEIRKKYLQEIDKYTDLYIKLERSKSIFELDKDYTENEILIKRDDINRINKKLSKREEYEKVVKNKLLDLKTIKSRKADFNKLDDEKKNLLLENEKIKLSINQISQSEKLIFVKNKYDNEDNFIRYYNSIESELFLLKVKRKFLSITDEIKTKKLKIKHAEEIVLSKTREQTNLINTEAQIKEKIEKLNEHLLESKEGTVNQLVRQVQEHLIERKDDLSHCLVCGEDFEVNSRLKEKIQSKIEELNESLSVTEQKLLTYNTTLNINLTKSKELFNQIESTSMMISDNKKILEELEVERIKIKSKNNFEDSLDISKEVIIENITRVEKYLEENKLAYSLINDLNELKQESLNINKSYNEKLLNMEKIANYSPEYKRFIISSESLINNKLESLNNYLTMVEEEKTIYKQRINNIHDEISKFQMELKEYESINNYVKSIIEEFKTEDHLKWVTEIEKTKKQYVDFEYNLGLKINQINQILKTDNLREKRIHYNNMNNHVEDSNKVISEYNKLIDTDTEVLKNHHIKVSSTLVSNYLKNHSYYINKLFSQITPHAIYKYVNLVPKGKNLYIVLTKEEGENSKLRKMSEVELRQQFNASLKFSSGQSNVLAVCIFLALNYSQKWTSLKFLGIDDPFQNLDDINVFSFLDVLSQIVLNQNKQVIISTHNDKFASLLRMKMGLNSSDIGTITLSGYSEDVVKVSGNCIKSEVDGLN
ncbi:SMC family ATPase [Alkalihalobacillus sp. FSL W8-0930]